MDNSKIYDAHLVARHIASNLASAHDYHSFSKCRDEQTKDSGQIWVNSRVLDARDELATLADYFGFDLVKRDELSKQEAA